MRELIEDRKPPHIADEHEKSHKGQQKAVVHPGENRTVQNRSPATVCGTTIGIVSRFGASGPIRSKTVKVKGTKVIRATSFVAAMLEKKQSRTRSHTSCGPYKLRAAFICRVNVVLRGLASGAESGAISMGESCVLDIRPAPLSKMGQ